jgi:cytochrome c556
MNDEFLYRIRTEPPASFARALKDRLDHTSRRRAKLASFGFGLFLFGTAFAMMSPAVREIVAGWFDAKPNEREVAQVANAPVTERGVPAAAAPPGAEPSPPLQSASATEGEFPPDRMRAEDGTFAVGVRPAAGEPPTAAARRAERVASDNERPSPEQRAARLMELLDEVEKHLSAEASQSLASSQAAPDSSYEDLQPPQSEFIVTGPLLAEPNTAPYAFQQRRALFSVMAWTMEPVAALLKKPSEFDDARKIEVSGRRLEQLALMIPDAFAYDSRKSGVPTRALRRVWEEPELFRKRVEEMQVAARLLTIAALKGNEMGVRQAASRVTFVCMKCHEEFRENANNNVGALYP